jgi:hypothetical protein
LTCQQFTKRIATGGPLSAEAKEHLRTCPECAQIAAIEGGTESGAIDPALEGRIIEAITADLRAARALPPTWQRILATLAVAIAVAATGILMLGTTGWGMDSFFQRAYFTTCLSAGLVAAAVLITQLMVPGSLLILTPKQTIALGIVFIAGGALLYPATYYDKFARAAAACFSIGLGHAVVASALTFLVVRRGALVSRVEMTSMVALAGAFAGVSVLYIFCPHRDLGHVLLGHALVPVAATAIGVWIAHTIGHKKPAPHA